jgi:predicted ATP-binding protein involved in virulence
LQAELGDEVADPEATMDKLEQEDQDRESNLLAQISNLDDRARSYKERLDELASTNAKLREALHIQELGTKA